MGQDEHLAHTLTPEEMVANAIVIQLVKEGLLLEDDADLTYYGLLEGKLRQSDWRLLAEKAAVKEVD
jgi:hypothetical protein